MSGPEGIRADFVRMVARSESTIDLAQAALLVAAESDASVDIEAELSRFEAWGDELRGRLQPDWNNLQKLARLRAFLFEDLGFRGDRKDYFSPRNSLLHEVLHRRLGIPLTLSIVMLELGWRVGMPLEGVGFPGHFLVRLAGEPQDLLLDAYARGVSVHEEDCRRMLLDSTGGRVDFEPGLIASVGKRDMIVRLLNNLKNAYVRRGEDALALGVVDRLLIMDPHDATETRDRGLLLFRMREYAKALGCLVAYLEVAPRAGDRETVEKHIGTLRQLLSTLN
jgi:regulator of sirC expression with transglutaminase-like and TPR domain